jgi:uncharacterized protein DUF3106
MKILRQAPGRAGRAGPLLALALALAMAAPAGGTPAQEEPGTGEKASAGAKAAAEAPEPPRPANIERWRSLSPEKKERLREIYRRLETLPPAERKALLERLRNMDSRERQQAIDAARQRLKSGAPEDKPRAKASKGSPHPRKTAGGAETESKTALRAREIEGRLEKTVARWTDQLPAKVRDRVKLFTRREQIELFRTYRETEVLMRALPDRSERDRLLALPSDRLRALARPEADRPEGISTASWDRWRGLRPAERLIAIRRLEKLRGEAQDPPAAPAPRAGSGPAASRSSTASSTAEPQK